MDLSENFMQKQKDDDLFNDFDDISHGNHKQDLLIEQRATNRYLNELQVSGYRDGRQKYMEDEKLIQSGFDIGYKQLVKLAFLTGQVKAICCNSSRLKSDSAFLARLNDRLEKIEKFHYEKLLNWKITSKEVEPSLEHLTKAIIHIESKLNEFKNFLFILNTSLNESFDIEQINHYLSMLEITQLIDHDGLSKDEQLTDEEKRNNEQQQMLVNNLIQSFNI